MENGKGEGVAIKTHNLKCPFMSFNMLKEVIVIRIIKIKFLRRFDFCCQFESRCTWDDHYYKDYWLGLFSSPFLIFKYITRKRPRQKKKKKLCQHSIHEAELGGLFHAKLEPDEAMSLLRRTHCSTGEGPGVPGLLMGGFRHRPRWEQAVLREDAAPLFPAGGTDCAAGRAPAVCVKVLKLDVEHPTEVFVYCYISSAFSGDTRLIMVATTQQALEAMCFTSCFTHISSFNPHNRLLRCNPNYPNPCGQIYSECFWF